LQRWNDAASITLGVKSLNEIMWLLKSNDSIYELWLEIKKQWLNGKLPGKDGECSKVTRDDNSLTINMLKGFEGISDQEVIKDLLQKVLDHE
jgi:hypothetical protein